jgi:hypothetical protein
LASPAGGILGPWSRVRLRSCRSRSIPTPVIEAYKKDVDRTLLRENLRLTTTERVRKMIAALRFAETVRRSRVKADAT